MHELHNPKSVNPTPIRLIAVWGLFVRVRKTMDRIGEGPKK